MPLYTMWYMRPHVFTFAFTCSHIKTIACNLPMQFLMRDRGVFSHAVFLVHTVNGTNQINL